MALSAARSYLFNLVLDRRVCDGTWNRLLPGDLANLDGSGSIFHVDRGDDQLEARAAQGDLHPTGPLWGAGGPRVSGAIAALERSVLEERASFAQGLEAQKLEQARRALRVKAADMSWHAPDEHTLSIEFTLGRGSFATSILREVVRPTETTSEDLAEGD
jgi:tRNA pseudouridine13 synthase